MLANDGVSETVPDSRPAPRKTGVTTPTCFYEGWEGVSEDGGSE